MSFRIGENSLRLDGPYGREYLTMIPGQKPVDSVTGLTAVERLERREPKPAPSRNMAEENMAAGRNEPNLGTLIDFYA